MISSKPAFLIALLRHLLEPSAVGVNVGGGGMIGCVGGFKVSGEVSVLRAFLSLSIPIARWTSEISNPHPYVG